MDPTAKAAAMVISQHLNEMQNDLDLRLKSTPPSCLLHEELEGLWERIQQLRNQLDQIES
ncbi:MAG: hypothetical protein GX825_03265 [Syntrophomonadaceae bacterium]|nr:hypothetical protein [Syntrophomonadaceae bacterium]